MINRTRHNALVSRLFDTIHFVAQNIGDVDLLAIRTELGRIGSQRDRMIGPIFDSLGGRHRQAAETSQTRGHNMLLCNARRRNRARVIVARLLLEGDNHIDVACRNIIQRQIVARNCLRNPVHCHRLHLVVGEAAPPHRSGTASRNHTSTVV